MPRKEIPCTVNKVCQVCVNSHKLIKVVLCSGEVGVDWRELPQTFDGLDILLALRLVKIFPTTIAALALRRGCH